MDYDRSLLLKTARKSLETYFSGEEYVIPSTQIRRGAFVTLRKHGTLRGCIGYMTGIEPLYKEVFILARDAAFNDFRFPPLERAELEELTIEVSVLTEPEKIETLDEFVLSRDGIIFSQNGRRAVFLPQVADETGWDKNTLLSELSLKAGLGRNSWKSPDAVFMTFQAEVSDESNL